MADRRFIDLSQVPNASENPVVPREPLEATVNDRGFLQLGALPAPQPPDEPILDVPWIQDTAAEDPRMARAKRVARIVETTGLFTEGSNVSDDIIRERAGLNFGIAGPDVPVDEIRALLGESSGRTPTVDAAVLMEQRHPEYFDIIEQSRNKAADGLMTNKVYMDRSGAVLDMLKNVSNVAWAGLQNQFAWSFSSTSGPKEEAEFDAVLLEADKGMVQAVDDFLHPGRLKTNPDGTPAVKLTRQVPPGTPAVEIHGANVRGPMEQMAASALYADSWNTNDPDEAARLRTKANDLRRMWAPTFVHDPGDWSLGIENTGLYDVTMQAVASTVKPLLGKMTGTALVKGGAKLALRRWGGTPLGQVLVTSGAQHAGKLVDVLALGYTGYATLKLTLGDFLREVDESGALNRVPEGKTLEEYKRELWVVGLIDASVQAGIEIATFPSEAQAFGGLAKFFKNSSAEVAYHKLIKDGTTRQFIAKMASSLREAAAGNAKEEGYQSISDSVTSHVASWITDGSFRTGTFGDAVVDAATSAVAGAAGSFGMSLGHVAVQIGERRVAAKRAQLENIAFQALHDADPEFHTMLQQVPGVRKAVARAIMAQTGTDPGTLYISGSALRENLKQTGEDITEFATRIGMDAQELTDYMALDARVPIKLVDYARELLGKDLGKRLLEHTTSKLDAPTLSEIRARESEDDKLAEAELTRPERALAWERVGFLLDTYVQDLNRLKLPKKLIVASKMIIEKSLRVAIARGWHNDPLELAKAYIPIVVDKLTQNDVTNAQIPEAQGRELAAIPGLTSRVGAPPELLTSAATIGPDGRPMVAKELLPQDAKVRFIPAWFYKQGKKLYFSKRAGGDTMHATVFQEHSDTILSEVAPEHLETLMDALLDDTAEKPLEDGFIDTTTGKYVSRQEAQKITGRVMDSLSINEVSNELQFARMRAFHLRVQATLAERIKYDAEGKVVKGASGDMLLSTLLNRSIIGLTTSNAGNMVSVIHELGHVFFNMLMELSAVNGAPADIQETFQAALEASGWKNRQDYLASQVASARAENTLMSLIPYLPQAVRDGITSVTTLTLATFTFTDAPAGMAPAEAAKELRAAAEDIVRYRANIEVFAEKFEQYVTTQNAPSSKLSRAFALYRTKVVSLGRSFYNGIVLPSVSKQKLTDLGQQRSPLKAGDVAMFDVMFATDAELQHRINFENSLVGQSPQDDLKLAPEQQLEQRDKRIAQLQKTAQQVEARAMKKVLTLVKGEMARFVRLRATEIIERGVWESQTNEGMVWKLLFADKTARMTAAQAEQLFGKGSDAYKALNADGRLLSNDFTDPTIFEVFNLLIADGHIKSLELREIADAIAAFPGDYRWHQATRVAHAEATVRFGKQLDEMNDRQKVYDAIVNDKVSVEWLEAELSSLYRTKLGGKGSGMRPLFAKIRDSAKMLVQNLTDKELASQHLQSQEERYARQAMVFALEGNYRAAFAAYQQRMMYVYAAQEAAKIRQHFKDLKALIAEISDQKNHLNLARAGEDFTRALDILRFALGMKGAPDVVRMADYQALRVMAENVEFDESMELLWDHDLLVATVNKMIDGAELRDLTVKEAENVDAALRQIRAAANRRIGELGQIARDMRLAFVERMKKDTALQRPGTVAGEGRVSLFNRMRRARQSRRAAVLDITYFAGRLGQSAYDFFYRRFQHAQLKDNLLSRQVLAKVLDIFENLPKDIRANLDTQDLDASDLPLLPGVKDTRDRSWMMMLILQMGSPGNVSALLRGYMKEGWTYEKAVRFIEKNATQAELAFAREVWEFMDESLYPLIREQYTRVNGVDPSRAATMPLALTLKDGTSITLEGGYFPIRYRRDPGDVSRSKKAREAKSMREIYEGSFQGANVAKGFTFARKWTPTMADILRTNEPGEYDLYRERKGLPPLPTTEREGYPKLELDMRVLPRHISEVLHYVVYDTAVREMWQMVETPEFADAAKSRIGDYELEQIRYWIRDLAAGRYIAEFGAGGAWDAKVAEIKQKTVMQILGNSLRVPLGDFANPIIAFTAGKVSVLAMSSSYASMVNGGFMDNMEFAEANSLTLQVRWDRRTEKLRAQVNDIVNATNVLQDVENWLKRNAWHTFDAMDKAMTTVVWTAAYNQEMEGKPPTDAAAHHAAVEHADRVIAETFPPLDILEKPGILRDRGAVSSLIVFATWFLKMRSLQQTVVDKHLDKVARATLPGKALAYGELAMRVLGTWAAMQILGEWLSGRGPDDKEELAEWVARKMISAPLLMTPVFGTAMDAAVSQITGKGAFSARSSPAIAYFERLSGNGAYLVRWMDGKKGTNDEKAALAALDILFGLRGLPNTQPFRMYEGLTSDDPTPATVVFGPKGADRYSVLNPGGP